jgi:TonB family protein
MNPEKASGGQRDVRPAPPLLAQRAPHYGAPGEQHFLPAAPARPHHLRDLALLALALVCVAAFATQAFAQSAEPAAPAGEKPPVPIKRTFQISAADYPAQSVEAREGGITNVSVLVRTDGRVQSCTVIGTSGASRLDKQACLIAIARWQFEPATLDGKPVPSSVQHQFRWAMRGNSNATPRPLPPEQQHSYLRPAELDATAQAPQ